MKMNNLLSGLARGARFPACMDLFAIERNVIMSTDVDMQAFAREKIVDTSTIYLRKMRIGGTCKNADTGQVA